MWGGHSCPPTAATKNDFTRTTLRETTETSIRLSKEDLRPGKLTKEEQRDDAGQFVGSGRGAPEPGCARSEATTAARRRRPQPPSQPTMGSKKPRAALHVW